jgi:hypothetical protein
MPFSDGKETAMGLALFSVTMFFAMVVATIHALRDEACEEPSAVPVTTDRLRSR